MNNENMEQVQGELLTLPADPPQTLSTKPGYLTSQFGLTATFALICTVLAWFGISTTPEQIDSYLALVERISVTIGPILASVWAVVTYINSRGKIASNTLNNNAAVQVASVAGLHGLGSILGGKNWKDPQRYLNIGQIAGQFVPGVSAISGGVSELIPGKIVEREPQFTEAEMRILKQLLANASKNGD